MAKEILLTVRVNDQDVEQLTRELDEAGIAFKQVQKEADKASNSVDDVAKNGGAIATLDRLTGGLASQLRDAFEASKLFNGSLKATRAALIATGVGAFAVALGTIVAYWDEIVELITGANARLEKQLELLEANLGVLDKQIANLEKQIEFEEASGRNADHLIKQRQVLLEQANKENELRLEGLRRQLSRLESTQSELTIWEQIEAGFFRMFGGSSGLAQKSVEFAQKREAEVTKLKDAIAAAEGKAIDLNIAMAGGVPEGAGSGSGSSGSGGSRESVSGLEALTPQDAARVTSAQLLREALVANANATADELYQIQVKSAQDQAEIDRIAAENKMKLMEGVGAAASALSGVLGQQTAAGKAFAVASALIDTYAAIAGQLKAFAGVPIPGYAVAQAVATGIFGFANVQRILSVQTPQASGGGGIPGVGGIVGAGAAGGISQPQFNILGDTGINQLDDSINRQNNRPQRAYVVAGDVSTAQELERSAIFSASV